MHPPAPALPPYSQERPTFLRSTRCLDLSTHRGLWFTLMFFPTTCWLSSCDDNTVSSPRRLAADWTRETFFPFYFFFKLSFSHCALRTPAGPITAQCAQVQTALLSREQHRDFLLLLLISTWSRKWAICWNWFVQWLARLDLKLYSESCNNKVRLLCCFLLFLMINISSPVCKCAFFYF